LSDHVSKNLKVIKAKLVILKKGFGNPVERCPMSVEWQLDIAALATQGSNFVNTNSGIN
jgi:hypothetical protein